MDRHNEKRVDVEAHRTRPDNGWKQPTARLSRKAVYQVGECGKKYVKVLTERPYCTAMVSTMLRPSCAFEQMRELTTPERHVSPCLVADIAPVLKKVHAAARDFSP
jgi:hypothetical protein